MGDNEDKTQLGPIELGFSGLLMVVVVFVSAALDLHLEERIATSAVRCAVQLTILSAFILEPIFEQNSTAIVLPYVGAITLLAARESSSRLTYVYKNIRAHFVVGVSLGTGSVMAYACAVILRLRPWWEARLFVPIAGMVLGNQVTATSLATEGFLRDVYEGMDRVNMRLCRGASWIEAALPSVRLSLRSALAPTLNMMAVMGLISIPGMMTGQLLGGAAPLQAGLYQVMIMYLLTGAAVIADTVLVFSAAFTVFDAFEHALRPDVIKPVVRKGPKRDILLELVYTLKETAATVVSFGKRLYKHTCSCGYVTPSETLGLLQEAQQAEEVKPTKEYYAVYDAKLPGDNVVFEATDVVIARTGLKISIALSPGTVTAMQGETGAGKSTTLKVLARLEPRVSGNIYLDGIHCSRVRGPEWRCRVVYVPQDRPTLSGSPMEFYDLLRGFRAQRRRCALSGRDYDDDTLAKITANWGLDASKLEQPWSTLSGGEAQRCSLGIALALRPEVLLLDEPTSALDDVTCRKVEKDFARSGAAVLVVTHSPEQANRIAHYHVKLLSRQSHHLSHASAC